MGRAHSLAWQLASSMSGDDLRTELAVLVDVDKAKAEETARRFGWQASATSWEAVVAASDIDIVDICTPPHLHGVIALAAIEAGKHVFCEKPLSNDATEAAGVAGAAAQARVTAQVGFNYRHAPAVAFAKQLLQEGRLGQPLQFRGAYLQSGPSVTDPSRWRASGATGGSGLVGDVGSHVIDIAEYLVGDITRVVSLVRARRRSAADGWMGENERLAGEHLDSGAVWLADFSGGAVGSFAGSGLAVGRANQLHFELDGTDGAVEFDWNRRDELLLAVRDDRLEEHGFRRIITGAAHPDARWQVPGLGSGYLDVMAIQFHHFLQAAHSRDQAVPDLSTGSRVQRVVEAVHESARTGAWVSLNGPQGGSASG